MASKDEAQEEKGRSRGFTTLNITLGGIISIAGLAASGVTAYNAIQSDLTALKRGETFQERVNEQHREDIRNVRTEQKEIRAEQRETMKEFNDKLDRAIEQWNLRRKN